MGVKWFYLTATTITKKGQRVIITPILDKQLFPFHTWLFLLWVCGIHSQENLYRQYSGNCNPAFACRRIPSFLIPAFGAKLNKHINIQPGNTFNKYLFSKNQVLIENIYALYFAKVRKKLEGIF